jgi:hypothetical protein
MNEYQGWYEAASLGTFDAKSARGALRQVKEVYAWDKRAYPNSRKFYVRLLKKKANMATRRKRKKTGTVKRVGAALTRFLKKQNPAKMRGVKQVRVRKLKGGGVTITPVRTIGNPRRRRNGKVISGYGSTTMNPRRRRKR